MPRYIDADALKANHGMKDACAECDKELIGFSKSCQYDTVYTLMDFCGWIDDMPTIDHIADDSKKVSISRGHENDKDNINRRDAIRWIKTECNPYGKPSLEYETSCRIMEHLDRMPSAQPEIIRCKDCKYCEHWYADKGRCFLWHEDGIDVFGDGFCNYAGRRTDE